MLNPKGVHLHTMQSDQDLHFCHLNNLPQNILPPESNEMTPNAEEVPFKISACEGYSRTDSQLFEEDSFLCLANFQLGEGLHPP